MEKNSLPSLKDAAKRNSEVRYSDDFNIEEEYKELGLNKKYFIIIFFIKTLPF